MFASNFLPSPGPRPKSFFTETSLSDLQISSNDVELASKQNKLLPLRRKPFSTIREQAHSCSVDLLIPFQLYNSTPRASHSNASPDDSQNPVTPSSNQDNLFSPPTPLPQYTTSTILPSQLLSPPFSTSLRLILISLPPSSPALIPAITTPTTTSLIIHSSNLTLTLPHHIYEKLGLQGRSTSSSAAQPSKTTGGGAAIATSAKGKRKAVKARRYGQGRKIHHGKGKGEEYVVEVDLKLFLNSDIGETEDSNEEEKGKSGKGKMVERIRKAFERLDDEVGSMRVVWRAEDDASTGNQQQAENMAIDQQQPRDLSAKSNDEALAASLHHITETISHLSSIRIFPFPKDIDVSQHEDDIHDLHEWLSLCFLGSDRVKQNDSIDPLFSRYQVPSHEDGEERAQDLVKVCWEGFISDEFIMEVFVQGLRAGRGGEGGWFAMSVLGVGGEAYTILGNGERVLVWEFEE